MEQQMEDVTAPIIAYEDAEPAHDRVTIYDFTDIKDVNSLRGCPYCTSRNVVIPSDTDQEGLCRCTICGWWKLLSLNEISGGFGRKDISSLTAIAREFTVSALDIPIRALRSFLAQHPSHMAHVDPNVFEKLMADCLRDLYDPCEVIHVGGTDDGGIDLKLILADSSCYLVQVKRRSKLHLSEGVSVVRSLNGVLFKEGVPRGMVITTARAFTARAVESTVIKTPTVVPYDMKLLAFNEVKSMLQLEPVLPYEPWKKFSSRGKEKDQGSPNQAL